MQITWRERLRLEPQWQDFSNWPTIYADHIPKTKWKGYLKNRQMIACVLAGHKLNAIAKEQRCSPTQITHLLNRCLGGEPNALPALTSALIPFQHICQSKRQKPLATLDQVSGNSNAFRELLQQLPEITQRLDLMIQAQLKGKVYAQNLRPQQAHQEFLSILQEYGWPKDTYPYTTDSLAYESVRRYFHLRVDELRQQALTPKRQRAIKDHNLDVRALNEVQIDSQVLDIHASIHLALNDELLPLRVSRASLLVATDTATDCILGYHLALTKDPTQQDLLTLLDNCIVPWKPLTLTTPEFAYSPGAAFPSGLNEQWPITLNTVQLDNALTHMANTVKDVLCRQLGATISLGIPATPKTRRWVEADFHFINQHLTHRFSSTTGSHPLATNKEHRKNLKETPPLSMTTLEEAISIVLSKHNVTPRSHLGGATPLNLFQHHCENHWMTYTPEALRQYWSPFTDSHTANLKWNKRENRAPHIFFLGQRYTGNGLITVATTQKKIRIEFNRRDIRTVKAFTLEGKQLGELKAPLSWQRFPHSVTTRKAIQKFVRKERFREEDPIAGYMRALLKEKENPKTALTILRLFQEGFFEPQLVKTESSQRRNGVNSITSASSSISPWSTQLSTQGIHHVSKSR